MDSSLFVRSLIIGFSIAAPVGSIGILCIRRTLASGRAIGFASGLGAASADAGGGLLGAYASTFLLTPTNPMTILSFAAVFAGRASAAVLEAMPVQP